MSCLQVPHTQCVSFSVGSCVIIKGTPPVSFDKDPQLQVDFHTGTNDKSDIAFHFRVYFGRHVVMNSFEEGGWKHEVRLTHMPFAQGRAFELRILVLHDEYQVVVNGQHYFGFAHRLKPESVKMVHVWRDVSLTSVNVV
ncbi:galectin-10 [Microcebus murinus]|nr:galectin-10-like [Microcebus murinus]